MSLDSSELEWALRLSEQLKTLSEVAESLTYRMLELEERFAVQDHRLNSRQLAAEQSHSHLAGAMEERMLETEKRLARLDDLLRNVEPRTAPPSPLRALSRLSPMPIHDAPHGETALEADLPFEDDSVDQSLAS
jgi:hypothetical protein